MRRDERASCSRLVNVERARRRTIMLGIGLIVTFALSPLVSPYVLPIGGAGVGRSHLVAFCVVALQALTAPLYGVFHALFWGGLLYAVGDRVRAWMLGRKEFSLLVVHEAGFGSRLHRVAAMAGLDPARVRTAAGLPGVALTIGWWTPSIYVAHEAIERLDDDQLAAVLAHEGEHARRRDPLRLSVLRFLSCLFFWLPALRQLAEDLADEIEIIADDAAAAEHPLVLASALVDAAKFARYPLPQTAVGFHARPLLERRVLRLIGEEPAPHSHLTRRSTIGAALGLLLAVGSGAIMASSRGPIRNYTEHCRHHDRPVTSHLFCLFDQQGQRERSTADCLHQPQSRVT